MSQTEAQKSRLYRERHPEKAKENSRRWRESRPGYGAAWRAANPDYYKVYAPRYYKEHKVEKDRKDADRRCRETIAAQQILGGKCVICGLDDPAILEFDHVNNDGYQHRLEGVSGKTLDLWAVRHPEEARERLQLLCANCHKLKHSRFQNCPGYEYVWDGYVGLE